MLMNSFAADDSRLCFSGLLASFSEYQLTTNIGKQLESFGHAHILFLLYTLMTSCRGNHVLSIGFAREIGDRARDFSIHSKTSCSSC